MKLNAVKAMLIVSLIIILLYTLGLFLPIIKNSKETNKKNFQQIENMLKTICQFRIRIRWIIEIGTCETWEAI